MPQIFRSHDAVRNAQDALAAWEEDPTTTLFTLRHRVAVADEAEVTMLLGRGWQETCPEALTTE